MILVHRTSPGDGPFWVNPDRIVEMTANPETCLHMDSGNSKVVLESPEAVIERIVEFRRRALVAPPVVAERRAADEG